VPIAAVAGTSDEIEEAAVAGSMGTMQELMTQQLANLTAILGRERVAKIGIETVHRSSRIAEMISTLSGPRRGRFLIFAAAGSNRRWRNGLRVAVCRW
jgi:hypothetical protein